MGKRRNKTRKLLPPLKKTDMKNKKYKYRLDGTDRMRRMAMNEGVRAEAKRLRKTLKEAAINKKGRLNILRIYRRNKNLNHCRTITKDMKYLDKKYKLGKTKNICGKKTRKNKKGGVKIKYTGEKGKILFPKGERNLFREKKMRENKERQEELYYRSKYGEDPHLIHHKKMMRSKIPRTGKTRRKIKKTFRKGMLTRKNPDFSIGVSPVKKREKVSDSLIKQDADRRTYGSQHSRRRLFLESPVSSGSESEKEEDNKKQDNKKQEEPSFSLFNNIESWASMLKKQ
tara:strand:- start:33 stop:887 length:855 start_codon:yes stop_codon:yes gene_type:complete